MRKLKNYEDWKTEYTKDQGQNDNDIHNEAIGQKLNIVDALFKKPLLKWEAKSHYMLKLLISIVW